METHMEVTGIHVITALIAAALSSAFSVGLFGVKNEILAAAIGLIILYATGQISTKLFGKEDVSWFKDGVIPFLAIWYIVWIITYNYIAFPAH
ncbi:MAG: DUF5379 domain-containing protein [Methanobrevibacter sp.]|jgi:hypothetical protein|nr:DUF5379 domain-containing protein [Methanobrevibacter sp.]